MPISFGRHTTLARSVLCIVIPICLLNKTYHRPADIRGATNTLAIKTLEDAAKAERSTKPPPTKRRKLATARKKKLVNPDADTNQEEAYHFIGYVPFRGKVWELDGLKSKPVEVGELPASDPSPSGSDITVNRSWMDVVRPVLRMKMRKYGGGDDENGSIKFNLLAIVKDQFCKVSDQLGLLERERISLERQLSKAYPGGWNDKASCLSLVPAVRNVADVLCSMLGRPYFAQQCGGSFHYFGFVPESNSSRFRTRLRCAEDGKRPQNHGDAKGGTAWRMGTVY
jgi:hypothetical protein